MDDQETSSQVLTVAQAALVAGVSTKTVRRWIRSGRLDAGRAGDAYVITPDALQRAKDWTPSIDTSPVPWRAHGHVESTSTVSQLLDRLERQAQRIGQLEAELDHARVQLLALQAPSETATGRATDDVVDDTTQPTSARARAWWRWPWRRLHANPDLRT